MTQIKSHIGPTRRPGELGVHSIDHFNLVVPSLKDAERFYSSFGLDVRAEGDTLSVMTYGAAHRWALLLKVRRRNYPICPLAHSPMIFRGFAKSCNLAMFARLTPRRASSPTEYGSGIRTDCSSKFVSVKRPLQTRSRFASTNRGGSERKMHRTGRRFRPSDRDVWLTS